MSKNVSNNDKENNKAVLVGFLVILIVVLAVCAGLIIKKQLSNNDDNNTTKKDYTEATEKVTTIDKEAVPEKTDEIQHKTGTETIALFGVDSRSNGTGKGTRSDSLMVAYVDHDNETVKVASIYRDTMVHIEGHGYEKITHAHSYGGVELAVSTLNENFDLDITHYLTVNFNSVADLIDDMGGVDQDIDSAEVQYINGYIDEVNRVRGTSSPHITSAGNYLLDGTQAVAYSRIRYTAGGDYKRTERQRTILFKVFQTAKTLSTTQKIELMNKMMGEINTDYPSDEMLVLLHYLSQYKIEAMDAFPKVFYGGLVGKAWVEVPITLIDMNAAMHEFLYNETDYQPSAAVTEYNSVLQGKASSANNDLSGYTYELDDLEQ